VIPLQSQQFLALGGLEIQAGDLEEGRRFVLSLDDGALSKAAAQNTHFSSLTAHGSTESVAAIVLLTIFQAGIPTIVTSIVGDGLATIFVAIRVTIGFVGGVGGWDDGGIGCCKRKYQETLQGSATSNIGAITTTSSGRRLWLWPVWRL